jgi:hypothetical protein
MDYYIKLRQAAWLGHNGKGTGFDEDMKCYKTLRGARKRLQKERFYGSAFGPEAGIYQIDFSQIHCPVFRVE